MFFPRKRAAREVSAALSRFSMGLRRMWPAMKPALHRDRSDAVAPRTAPSLPLLCGLPYRSDVLYGNLAVFGMSCLAIHVKQLCRLGSSRAWSMQRL